nr:MAG TPA: baseplate subunit [Caudoviricetes sp.]
MKISVINDAVDSFKAGVKTSAGFTSKNKGKTLTAQFPAERASGNDASGYYINDLYNNGLLFTAYDYTSRTTGSLRDFRKKKNVASGFGGSVNIAGFDLNLGGRNAAFDREAIANILLPRSQSDVDAASHKFNDVGESVISRGGGTLGGALSNMASTAVFGGIESITGGYLADHGEQIYNTARSMYAGADARTKNYVWHLTPRSIEDLRNILIIYETFLELSYGSSGISSTAKELKAEVDAWYKNTLLRKSTPEEAKRNDTLFEGITDFISNVITVSNPTIWMISNFGKRTSFEGRSDVFGPAQISSVRLDKSPDGKFNGLAISPNLPSTFVLEVSFREILTLSRGTIFGSVA